MLFPPEDVPAPAATTAPSTQPTVTLYHGDCLKVMPTLAAGSVQFVFADLPYQVTRCLWDVSIDMSTFWSGIALTCGSTCVIVATADVRMIGDLLRDAPLPFLDDLVWHKSRSSGFLNAKRRPLRAHEHCLVFACGKPPYNLQMIREWRGRSLSTFARQKKTECYGAAEKSIAYTYGKTRYPRSVLEPESPASERGMHPTQKPVALLEWLIKTYTNEGDTVLDPTAGSMTTAIAALRTGRNVVCIEKDATYFEVARKRIADEQARLGFAVTV